MRLDSKTYIALRPGEHVSRSERSQLVRWFSEFSDQQTEKEYVFRMNHDIDIWDLIDRFCREFPKTLKKVSIGICRVLESSEINAGEQVHFSDGLSKSRLFSRLVDLGGVYLTNNIPAKGHKYRILTHRGEILLEYQMAALRSISNAKSVNVLPLRFEEEMPELFQHLVNEKGRILTGEGGFGKSLRAASLAEVWRVHFQGRVIRVDGRRHQGLRGVVSEIGRSLGVAVSSTHLPSLKFYDKVLIIILHCSETEDVIRWLEGQDNEGARYFVTTQELIEHPNATEVGAIDDYRIRLLIQYYNFDLTQDDLDILVPRAHGNLRLARWLGLQSKNLGVENTLKLEVGSSITASENIHLETIWATYSDETKNILKLMDICTGGMPIEIAKRLFSNEDWVDIAGVKEGRFRGDFFLRLHSESRVQLLPHASRFLNELEHFSHRPYFEEYCRIFTQWIIDHLANIDSSTDTPSLIALRGEVLNFGPIIEHGTEDEVVVVSRALEIISRRLGAFENRSAMISRILDRSQNEAARLLYIDEQIHAQNFNVALEHLYNGPFLEFEAEIERVKSLIFQKKNEFALSLRHADKSIALASKQRIDECRLRKAEVLLRFKKLDEARNLLLSLFETAKTENVIAKVLRYLGELLIERDESEKARPYLIKSIDYYKKVGSDRDRVEPLFVLACSAFHRGNIEEGESWFEDAEISAHSSGVNAFIEMIQTEKAYHYAVIGETIKAREQLAAIQGEKSLMNELTRVIIACDDMNTQLAHSIIKGWDFETFDANASEWVLASILKVYVEDKVSGNTPPPGSIHVQQFFKGRSQFLENHLRRRQKNNAQKKLILSSDAATIDIDGQKIDLGKRLALRRIVLALGERAVDGGPPVSVDETFAVGWIGEIATEKSRNRRVYSAIHRLKKLGIPVTRVSEGYVLEGYRVVFTTFLKL